MTTAKTLEQLRREAYAANAAHERDLKTNKTYAKVAAGERIKEIAAAAKKWSQR